MHVGGASSIVCGLVLMSEELMCTDPGFGKPAGLELPVSTHVDQNNGGSEADVVDSWEDCDAEIPGAHM